MFEVAVGLLEPSVLFGTFDLAMPTSIVSQTIQLSEPPIKKVVEAAGIEANSDSVAIRARQHESRIGIGLDRTRAENVKCMF